MYKNDKAHGPGTYIYAETGNIFEGQWENGDRNGHGTLTKSDLTVIFEGNYKDNMKNGKGKATYHDDSFYEGQYLDDVRCG